MNFKYIVLSCFQTPLCISSAAVYSSHAQAAELRDLVCRCWTGVSPATLHTLPPLPRDKRCGSDHRRTPHASKAFQRLAEVLKGTQLVLSNISLFHLRGPLRNQCWDLAWNKKIVRKWKPPRNKKIGYLFFFFFWAEDFTIACFPLPLQWKLRKLWMHVNHTYGLTATGIPNGRAAVNCCRY